ncbi:MAG TPA: amidohydrolase family protein, partial [Vicinamibacteria bacterium]
MSRRRPDREPSTTVSRRGFVGRTGAALAGLALGRAPRVSATPAFDLVIRGGTVLDGTGGPAFRADLGLAGDTIAALGEIAPEQAGQILDATGLHVAPGFIDIHTHSDPRVLAYPTADSRVLQGVTTELGGNCGGSAAPLAGQGVAERVEQWKRDGVAADWTGVASYLDRIDAAGISVNHALLAGHGSLRSSAIGPVDRELSAEEARAVARALEEA